MSDHPSFLDLDLVAQGVGAAHVLEHAERCEQCRAHLEAVRAPPPPAPWLSRLPAQPPRPSRWPLYSRQLGIGLAIAASLLLMLWLPPRLQPPDRSELRCKGCKGGPSVALYLKRGEQVSLLGPDQPVRAGDAIRFEVEPEDFPRVAVFGDEDAHEQIFSGATSERVLPGAWQFDDQPGPERLTVVFSREELSAAELERAVRENLRNDSVWTVKLQLPKETQP